MAGKVYLALLRILSRDVQSKPRPSPKCNDCKENNGNLCQGDLILCKSWELVRFQLKKHPDKTQNKHHDKRGKRQDPKLTKTKKERKKGFFSHKITLPT